MVYGPATERTHTPIWGSRRLAYISIGRALVLVSLPLLPLSTGLIARGSKYGWLLALLASVMFGSGILMSGPALLALVHDSAPHHRRGLSISIVQFMLVLSFAFLPLIFARMMPTFDLGASALFVFMQDAVLEPFGGDLFGLAMGETTRFNAFWGSGVLFGLIITMLLTRRWRPDQQVGTTMWDLGLLALPLIALGGEARTSNLAMVRPVLVLFGIGFGIFTAGGVSLLMAMSVEDQAAAYVALWSVIHLVSRGAGIAAGGILRDAALPPTGNSSSTYGLVFWLDVMGALACIWLLRRVDVPGFAAKSSRVPALEPMGVAAD